VEQPTVKEKLNHGKNNHPPHLGDSNLPCLGHLKKLLNCQTSRVIPAQHVIYSQGESPHSVCLICDGVVKVTRTESNGNRIIVGVRQKGWVLGAVSFILNTPYETTAETITRSKLCFVPAETFKQAMDTNAKFSQWISMILCRMWRFGILSISEKSCLPGRQRLEKFLWELVKTQSGSDKNKRIKIQMILKNWEVAQLLSLTPQHLCRLVKQLENEGIILKKNGWLILLDPRKLWQSERTAHDLS
jgi:CRP/FNR family cyclic AMP-dependent transcriptional regulator